MGSRKFVIGSRGSELALWQANHVKAQLEEKGTDVEIKIIKTRGDKIQNIGFSKMEGKGFFTKELEAELLNESIDIAVHSLKDLETTQPDGLILAAVSEREVPYDVLLIKPESLDDSRKLSLKMDAVVGTSAARRKAWLKALRPDIKTVDIRGNVPTRIGKVETEDLDAVVLAEAGLKRINADRKGLVEVRLDPSEFVPAPAQGVLGLQCRINDDESIKLLKSIGSAETEVIVDLERSALKMTGGGCQVPFGAYAEADGNEYTLRVAYFGESSLHEVIDGSPEFIKNKTRELLASLHSSQES